MPHDFVVIDDPVHEPDNAPPFTEALIENVNRLQRRLSHESASEGNYVTFLYPLGVMPRKNWLRLRLTELEEAIERFNNWDWAGTNTTPLSDSETTLAKWREEKEALEYELRNYSE